MKYRSFSLSILLSIFLPSLLLSQNSITAEIIADLQTVRRAAFSPDGSQIAISRRVYGTEDDAKGSVFFEIDVVTPDGSSQKNYIRKPASGYNIEWSPDGKYLYFLARRKQFSGTTQVFRIPLDGGEAELITDHETTVRKFRLSPDGSTLAFSATDVLTREEKLAISQGRDWIEVGRNRRFTRIYTQDLTGYSAPRLLSENDLHVSDFSWSPDGNSLIFRAAESVSADAAYLHESLYQITIQEKKVHRLARTEGKLGDFQVSPNGRNLAYISATEMADPIAQNLYVVEMSKGGTPKLLTEKWEASAESLQWQDNQTLLLHCSEGLVSSLYRLEVETGKYEKVFSGPEIIDHLAVHPSSQQVALVASTPQHPAELFISPLKKIRPQRLTTSNPVLDQIQLARQTPFQWQSSDGERIEGVLTFPLNYEDGRRYPLIVQAHGGPEAVSQHGWRTGAIYPIQLLAAHGFFVLEPNYRGSKGRGVAFSRANQQDLGGREFEDIMFGIDALKNRGLVDSERVGIGGFSYGGYLAAWGATKYSDLFACAQIGSGISNWISFTGTSDIPLENSLVHWDLWWFDEPELVWDRSPLAHLKDAHTPILILHGAEDRRVPVGQGYEFQQGLKLRNIPVNMVVYPRERHGIRERAHRIDYMNRSLKFFRKFLK